MQPGKPAYRAVLAAFGHGIVCVDGTIDRARLGSIVFRDPHALHRLEVAVHPYVIARVDERIAASTAATVVVEAIKLIEAGMHRGYDALWVVTAPRSAQIDRLVKERGYRRDEAALRVDAQPSQEEKAKLADLVLVNDSDLEALRGQVERAWEQIVRA
jgi:dephospho-CoA kinase